VQKSKMSYRVGVLLILLVLVGAGTAFASGSGMPWEGPLDKILNSLTGPIAKAVGIFAIFGTGAAMAFSEGGSVLKKAMAVVFGLSICFSAVTFLLPFLGFSGGAGF